MTYLFFVAIEKLLLPSHVVKPSESTDWFKQQVIDKIVQNDEVQWHWTLVSQTMDNAVELLTAIVVLWVTIRGVSLAATWMKVCNQETKKTTKKTKGLRKELSHTNT